MPELVDLNENHIEKTIRIPEADVQGRLGMYVHMPDIKMTNVALWPNPKTCKQGTYPDTMRFEVVDG